MPDFQGRFVWYELMTTDVGGAKAFYGDVLGWTFKDVPMPGMTYTLAHAGDAQVAGLMDIPPDAKAMNVPPNWTGYVAVADVDASAAQLSGLGGKIVRPPEDIPGVGRFAIVTDPQGAYLALFRGDGDGPTKPGQMQPGHVGWHELYTSDLEAGFAFYQAMFGWTLSRDMDMGPEMGPYRVFGKDGVDLGGMMKQPPGFPASAWGYYFNVGDIDETVAKFTGGGGQVMNGPMEVPGPMWVFNGMDPQRAYVSMVGTRK